MLELWFRQFADGPVARRVDAARWRPVMCGIAGFVAVDGLAADAAVACATRMRDVITHRGPDEAGLLLRRACGARASPPEHRRSEHRAAAARQRGRARSGWSSTARSTTTPTSAASSKSLGHRVPHQVGHRDHRPRLRAMGRRLRRSLPRHVRVRDLGRGRSAACCSCAIASASSRCTGRAPAARLLFGSEIKALLASGLVEPQANLAALPELLSTRYVSGAETMFRGINKLLPGHLLVFENGEVRIRQYWDVPARDADAARCRSWPVRSARRLRRAVSARCSMSRSGCG